MSIPSLKTLCLEAVAGQSITAEDLLVLPESLSHCLTTGHQVTVSKKRMGFLYDLKNANCTHSSDYLNTISTMVVTQTYWIPHDATVADLRRRNLEVFQPTYQNIGLQVFEVDQKKQILELGKRTLAPGDDDKRLSQFTEPRKALSVSISTHL